ncbi:MULTISPECIES: Crp/Fnr family transcriptional regulator [unclassified Sphingobium]|uniref:Crp/Fnr family transcriptional regulator n=1 Tax=unclassified Sphingobium TaxID=2611147 RepID=UPI002225A08E|nr:MULTISPECIES: Crp/Fnr family transcriptional regulator [unclassified Sphingobium]MCW2398434.1 CRP/FNR family transcriptional regulator [Sphingobium sp. B2D3C]
MTSCQQCVVRNRAICSSLDASELEVLNKIGRRVPVHRGQTLMWEGDDSLLVANVIDGVLKLSTSTADGREQIVGVVYPSDFIGRPFGSTTQHSVTALCDAQVCLFTRSSFDDFARTHPELEHKLLQRTLTELDRARHWMLLLGRKSAGERVATFLLEMAQRLADASCSGSDLVERFELPLTRQQMADLLGLTIETVSRQLTRLRQAGIIDLPDRRTVVILDHDSMEAEAGNG